MAIGQKRQGARTRDGHSNMHHLPLKPAEIRQSLLGRGLRGAGSSALSSLSEKRRVTSAPESAFFPRESPGEARAPGFSSSPATGQEEAVHVSPAAPGRRPGQVQATKRQAAVGRQ